MSTWKKSAFAALCAVALGGLAGCEEPGDYGPGEELREYPEKPEGTGAVSDQPAGLGTPVAPVEEPVQAPMDQPQGFEQEGIEQQGIEEQQRLEQEGIEQQQRIEEGMEPYDPELGTSGTEGSESGAVEDDDDTTGNPGF